MIILAVLLIVIHLLSQWLTFVFKLHQVGMILGLNGLLVLSVLANPALEPGTIPSQRGQFEQAIRQWQSLLATDKLSTSQQINLWIQMGNAYQALGLSPSALDALLQAKSLF